MELINRSVISSSKPDSLSIVQSNFCKNDGVPEKKKKIKGLDIKFNNLTYDVKTGFIRRENRRIVKEITGEFRSGELTAIVGPSGAGKSSLLNIISGYELFGTTGDVFVDGSERNIELFRANLSFITQDTDLQPFLTVAEAMYFSANLKIGNSKSTDAKKQRIKDVLQSVGMYDKRRNTTGKLSGGEKKRLAIALELVNNPPVLILDEPTTGLDSSIANQCISLLKKLALEGRTIVCTIHQPSGLAIDMFDQLYAIAEGKCIYSGGTRNLVPFLAELDLNCPEIYNPVDYLMEIATHDYGDQNHRLVEKINNGQNNSFQQLSADRLDKTVDRKKVENTPSPPSQNYVSNFKISPIKEGSFHSSGTTIEKCSTKESNSPVDVNHKPKKPTIHIDPNQLCNRESVYATPFYLQTTLLLKRTFLILWRDKSLTLMRIVIHLLMASLIGVLYYGIGDDAGNALNNFRYIFYTLMFVMYTAFSSILVNSKIQELCSNWGITDSENYALHNNHKFVTEKNRNEIKNGSVLRLQFAPSKKANDTLKILRSGSINEKVACLKELAALSVDLTFALEFIKEQGLTIIISMIEDDSSEDEILKYSLSSFVELMEHGTVSWEILQTCFVTRNIYIVRNFTKFPKECIESALSILENIVQNSAKYVQVENEVTFADILSLLQSPESLVVHQNTIALINALFMKADDARKRHIALTLSRKQYRSVLITDVTGTEIQHQLYVLQTLTLGLLENRMRMKISSHDQDAYEKIKELKKIAFDDYPSGAGIGDEQRRSGNVNFSHYYKKLGFKCEINPAQDFMETPPGILGLDCMAYFARNYTQQYTKVVHENACRNEHECPFAKTSIELVKMLCDILRIGEPPSEQSVGFHPMFFTHDHPFEEFFCICIITLNRTWKDMRATSEDFQKVLSVVREQIIRTLKVRPENLEDFRCKIAQLNYQTITNLRQQERTSKEECESTASAIVKLKEKITPDIINLIKQQRLTFLVEGTRFSKYSRGVRSKDKFWYARLSPNHKVIHYGDCDEKAIPTLEDLTNKVSVIDIKQLLVGKECPHMKEMRARKSAANLGFSITFDSMDHSTLDFVAPEELIFNYWTDGINALLGQEMCSKQKEEDFENLLYMEIKLRLLDTEGVDISSAHPAVPDDPENYDFCFEN